MTFDSSLSVSTANHRADHAELEEFGSNIQPNGCHERWERRGGLGSPVYIYQQWRGLWWSVLCVQLFICAYRLLVPKIEPLKKPFGVRSETKKSQTIASDWWWLLLETSYWHERRTHQHPTSKMTPGLLQLFHLSRSQGTIYLEIFRQMDGTTTIVFFGRSMVRLSTLFLQSLIIWVEYLTSFAMSLGMFWVLTRWWDYIGIISNPKGFRSLRVEATGKFWVMGESCAYGWPYCNAADLTQQNLTQKGMKLGVGLHKYKDKQRPEADRLSVSPVLGTWENHDFRLWSTRICPLSAE